MHPYARCPRGFSQYIILFDVVLEPIDLEFALAFGDNFVLSGGIPVSLARQCQQIGHLFTDLDLSGFAVRFHSRGSIDGISKELVFVDAISNMVRSEETKKLPYEFSRHVFLTWNRPLSPRNTPAVTVDERKQADTNEMRMDYTSSKSSSHNRTNIVRTRSRMTPDAQPQRGRVFSQAFPQVLDDNIKFVDNLAGKLCHDRGMLFLRLGNARHGHLKKYKNVSDGHLGDEWQKQIMHTQGNQQQGTQSSPVRT